MKTYSALLVQNLVTEIIVGDYVWANENLDGEWVDCSNNGELTVAIGWTYDPDTQEFTAPPTVEPDEPINEP